MTTWMKKANNFQIAKVQLQGILSFCLFFYQFQPGVAYQSVKMLPIKKACIFVKSSNADFRSSPEYLSDRSSHQMCSMKNGVLRNFTKFTEKHLCQGLFFNSCRP